MKTTLCALAPLLLTTGCVDPNPDDVSVGEVEQDVSSTQLNTWQCSSTCTIPLGSATNRTCFLGGISGNLQSALQNTVVGVHVVQSTPTTYDLIIDNAEHHTIGATTVCISGAVNRTFAHWEPGFPPLVSLGNGATQRCFLTGIYNFHGFSHTTDYLRVLKGNKNNGWFITGSVQAPGWSDVHSVCLDVPENVGDYTTVQGAGTIHNGLALNPQPPGGVACGITGLAGMFTIDSLTDGVRIDYNANGQQWGWTLNNYKTGWAECVR